MSISVRSSMGVPNSNNNHANTIHKGDRSTRLSQTA